MTTATAQHRPGYGREGAFDAALRARVAGYFAASGLSSRGHPGLYLKTGVLAFVLVASYALLVFSADRLWQGGLACVLLGLAVAGIGFNVPHDASHGSYSPSRRVNRVMALSLDAIGGSSYFWRWKHNVLHHTYPNWTGLDDDIDADPLARLSPQQPHRPHHRFQHLYLWPLYGLLAAKWHLFDDFWTALRGRLGSHALPRPGGWDALAFWLGKAFFFTWAFGIPLLRHSPWAVAVAYATASFVAGLTLSLVFQLAHSVPEAWHHGRAAGHGMSWAEHQVRSSADFARSAWFLTWYIGGLNFQIEHHLFPGVCHVHYPALAPVVQAACAEHGIPYTLHATLGSAVAAHYRWLRQLGSGRVSASPGNPA